MMMSMNALLLASVGVVSAVDTKRARFGLKRAGSGGGVAANSGGHISGTWSRITSPMRGWLGQPDAMFTNFPQKQLLGDDEWAYIPHNPKVYQGDVLYYGCWPGEVCEWQVLMYDCAPCSPKTLAVSAQLAAAGFKRTRCTPSFTTADGNVHKMIGWVMQVVTPNFEDFFEFEFEHDVDFLFVTDSELGSDAQCATMETDVACGNSLGGHCRWKGGSCERATCINQGPAGGRCDTSKCAIAAEPREEQEHPET